MSENDDTLGHRAKVGILVPASNTTIEPEMAALQPTGVTNHAARMSAVTWSAENLELYKKKLGKTADMARAIGLLSACAPSIIVQGRSINSFVGGLSGAHAMKAQMEAMSNGIRVILPSLAILRALEVLNRPQKLGILTPWMPPADAACKAFFEAAGYQVLAIQRLQHPTPHPTATDPELLTRAIDGVNVSGVECIVHVGTNSAMARRVEDVEKRIDKPMLTVNVVSYWAGLRFLGIHDKFKGYGRLAETH